MILACVGSPPYNFDQKTRVFHIEARRTYVILNALVTECGLVLRERDASNLATIVFVSERAESTPTAANVEQVVLGL